MLFLTVYNSLSVEAGRWLPVFVQELVDFFGSDQTRLITTESKISHLRSIIIEITNVRNDRGPLWQEILAFENKIIELCSLPDAPVIDEVIILCPGSREHRVLHPQQVGVPA